MIAAGTGFGLAILLDGSMKSWVSKMLRDFCFCIAVQIPFMFKNVSFPACSMAASVILMGYPRTVLL
jgi:hypothetical protein